MNTVGPILVLEDDQDDREILESVFLKLNISNNRRYFSTSESFLTFLRDTTEQPLMIFSDINMAPANGIELKRRIEDDPFLKAKSIPYVFLTTSANPREVRAAYDLNAQGYFVKGMSISKMSEKINTIVCYWKDALHPNNT